MGAISFVIRGLDLSKWKQAEDKCSPARKMASGSITPQGSRGPHSSTGLSPAQGRAQQGSAPLLTSPLTQASFSPCPRQTLLPWMSAITFSPTSVRSEARPKSLEYWEPLRLTYKPVSGLGAASVQIWMLGVHMSTGLPEPPWKLKKLPTSMGKTIRGSSQSLRKQIPMWAGHKITLG